MWLTNSSIGRKLVMAVTGACLVLFVTFHCLMNAICIVWPTAYNSICEFLGANWYAVLASLGLAVLMVIHIIYAVVLTIQNRKARGSIRYSIEKRPASVEWSSKNMLVLGIVILAFLVVHLIQFWAKMQLQEIRGGIEMIPATAGTLFIQESFSLIWTPIVYIIGFIALWFHMNHGFWSMFESAGWTNNDWIPRLKKIGCVWVSIVIALFIAQAIVFTVQAHRGTYKTDERLRAQYMEMVTAMMERDFGPDAAQLAPQGNLIQAYSQTKGIVDRLEMQGGFPSFEEFAKGAPSYAEVQNDFNMRNQYPNVKSEADWNKEIRKVYDQQKKAIDTFTTLNKFYSYLLTPAEKGEEVCEEAPAAQEEMQVEEVQAVEEEVIPNDSINQ